MSVQHGMLERARVLIVHLTIGFATFKLIADLFDVCLELDHLICICYLLSSIAELLHLILLVIEKVKLVTVEVF